MRFVVDRDRCVGAGMCALTAPETFDQGDDGLVRPRRTDSRADEAVRLAAEACPSGAIRTVPDPDDEQDAAGSDAVSPDPR